MFASGFFDSYNGDRKYSASDFAELINMLVTDGVAGGYKEQMMGSLSGDGYIRVGTGRAWANSTWNAIDSAEYIAIDPTMLPPSDSYKRLGVVYLEVDKSASVRANRLGVAYASSLVAAGTPIDASSFSDLIPSTEALGGGFALFGFAIVSSTGYGQTYGLAPLITGVGNQADIRGLMANMQATFDAFLAGAEETLSNTNAFLKLENEIAVVRNALPAIDTRGIITLADVEAVGVTTQVSATIPETTVWAGDITQLNGIMPKIHFVVAFPVYSSASDSVLNRNSSVVEFMGLAPGITASSRPRFLINKRPMDQTYTGGTFVPMTQSNDYFTELSAFDDTFTIISHDFRNWVSQVNLTCNLTGKWVDNGDNTQSLKVLGSVSASLTSANPGIRNLTVKYYISY